MEEGTITGIKEIVDINIISENAKYKHSVFFLTLNTNKTIEGSKLRISEFIELIRQCFSGRTNEPKKSLLERLFKIPDVERIIGKSILDQGIDRFEYIFSIEIGPRYHRLHAHIIMKVYHNGKIHIDREKIIEWWARMYFPNIYINIKGLGNITKNLENYIMKSTTGSSDEKSWYEYSHNREKTDGVYNNIISTKPKGTVEPELAPVNEDQFQFDFDLGDYDDNNNNQNTEQPLVLVNPNNSPPETDDRPFHFDFDIDRPYDEQNDETEPVTQQNVVVQPETRTERKKRKQTRKWIRGSRRRGAIVFYPQSPSLFSNNK